MEVKRHKNGSKEADPDQPNTWEGGIPAPAARIVVPGFPPPGQPNLSTGQPWCWKELGRLESWELGSQKIKRREKCDFPPVFKPTSLVLSFMPPYHPTTNIRRAACSLPNPDPSRGPRFAGPACLVLPIAENLCKPKKTASFIPQGSASPPCFPSHYSAWHSHRSRRGLASTLARQKPQDDEFSAAENSS